MSVPTSSDAVSSEDSDAESSEPDSADAEPSEPDDTASASRSNASTSLTRGEALAANEAPPSDPQVVQVAAAMLALLGVGVILWLGRGFLVPFTIALLLAAAVAPPAKWLERRAGVPHWATTTLALVATCGMTALVVGLGYLGMADIVEQAPKYRQEAVSAYNALKSNIEENLGKSTADQLPDLESVLPSQGAGQRPTVASVADTASRPDRVPPSETDANADTTADAADTESATQTRPSAPELISNAPDTAGSRFGGATRGALREGTGLGASTILPGGGTIDRGGGSLISGRSSGALTRNFLGLLSKTANSSLNILSGFFISLVFFAFFLIQRDGLGKKLRDYVVDRGTSRDDAQDMLDDMGSRVTRYLWLKAAISVVTGLVFGLVAWIGGLPFALFWGFLGFALNFIPAIGPVIASVPPVLLCYLQFSPGYATVLSIGLVGVQVLSGNIIEPKLLGNHLDMNIITVLLCLFFWGIVWGPMGMLLAVPLTAIIQIALGQQANTRPFARLMGATHDG